MIIIGGIGGSGTRVVAEILQKFSFDIGQDLNESLDNLLFTLLFKHQSILLYSDKELQELFDTFIAISTKKQSALHYTPMLHRFAKNDRTLHDTSWLGERIVKLTEYVDQDSYSFAFKEPNTHIIIDKLLELYKELKFIYVYRDALDMSYSSNQNQLRLWGPIFFNSYDFEINPKNSLKYWCMVHRRILQISSQFPHRVMMLPFDTMCKKPQEYITEIASFVNKEPKDFDIATLSTLIKTPKSIGRAKEHSLESFELEDLNYLRSIGML